MLARNLWLHARDKLTHRFSFFHPRSHWRSFILLSPVCTSSVCSLYAIIPSMCIPYQKYEAIPWNLLTVWLQKDWLMLGAKYMLFSCSPSGACDCMTRCNPPLIHLIHHGPRQKERSTFWEIPYSPAERLMEKLQVFSSHGTNKMISQNVRICNNVTWPFQTLHAIWVITTSQY